MADPIVMYVDDEEGNRLVFEQTFFEHNVVVAKDGYHALELLTMNYGRVAIVLADQRMPGMSGNELLAEVKARQPEVARVVVSAYNDVRSILAVLNEELASRYIIKPWDADEVDEIIVNAVAKFHRRSGP